MPGEQLLRAAGGAWTAVAASARGSVHTARGAPNEDATALAPLPQPLRGVVAAVADGHGGDAYVRAREGARCAAATACAVVAELLPGALASAASAASASRASRARLDARALERTAATAIAELTVERWRRAVAADADRRPFSREEARTGGPGVDLAADPVRAYGSTLVLGAAWDGGVLLLQLGDGDVLVVDDCGRTTAPVPGDPRLRGGLTTSLCSPGAPGDVRVAVLTEEPALVVLATDGYGSAFADAAWRPRVGRDLLAALTDHGVDGVAGSLEGWLGESAQVGGDDTTVAVLHRPYRSAPPPH